MANPRTIARLCARIHERAAHCLQFEIKDPRASFATITRVELTNDLSLAKVYYSVLGDEGDRSKVAHMLEHATGFVQRQVVRVLKMRRAPALRFVYDDSIETAAAIDKLIREARERDRRIDPTLAEREAAEARIAEEDAAAREAARIAARDAARAAAKLADADAEEEEDSGADEEFDEEPAPDDADPERANRLDRPKRS
ncbi:MAG: 30S ribosome-binding factor RbfA [Planctomycetota bacterium]|nr:30S ribosome-binding factor RbfA [Planctomycetota bacterium]